MHEQSDFRDAGRQRFSRPGFSNNAYASKREAAALAITNDHEVTADDLVALGIFPDVAKSLRRLSVLERRKRVRRVGYVKVGNRLKILWAGFRVPVSKLEHNHVVSRLGFGVRAHDIRCGSQVESRWEFDLEAYIDGQLAFAVEYDNHQERYGQVERRMRKVADCPADVLWVVRTELRRERFLAIARRAAPGNTLVALLDDALHGFHGPIWHEPDGGIVAVEGCPEHETWLAAICQPLR